MSKDRIKNRMPLTEQRNKKSANLDRLSIKEILRIMNDEDKTVAEAVQRALPQIEKAIAAIVPAMRKGGRLVYAGAGSSGRLGVLDAAECQPTFGVKTGVVSAILAGGDAALRSAIEGAEDNKSAGEKDIVKILTVKDAVVGISASGRTPYVLGAIEAANRLGALTVGISGNRSTALSATAGYPIEILTGPEIISGSTRLMAGTAQKMVLNMISTTTMIKLGKVYGNLMINVQAASEKLRDRALQIISQVTGVDHATARRFNQQANGDVRIAILMIEHRIEEKKARSILKTAGDHFGAAMNIDLSSENAENVGNIKCVRDLRGPSD